jgi:ABC-type phosphate transport system substrate-binding protein
MKTITTLILMLIAVFQMRAQVSVIANKSVSDASLTAAKVGSVYSLELTKWTDGAKIVVFDNATDAKEAFYAGIGKDQLSLKKIWMKKQLTGEAKAPETASSDEDVVKKVSSTPGAIGYVKSSAVTGAVKVLLELK